MNARRLTPLEEENLKLRGGHALGEAKALLRENLTTVNVVPPPLTEEEKHCSRILTEQLEEGMELMATEAKEALALDPRDETAQRQLLQYNQWQRTKNDETKNKSGLTITKGQRHKGQRNTAVWQRTKAYGWLLKVTGKNVVGEMVNVRRKGGTTIPMQLTGEVAPGYFRAREV
jgi:hypothetical protein